MKMFNLKEMFLKKKMKYLILASTLLALLVGCGGKGGSGDEFDGFYHKASQHGTRSDILVEIDGNNIKYWGNGNSYCYVGTIEKGSEGTAEVYFTSGNGLNGNDPGRFNPLGFKLTEGNDTLIITSDSSNWNTDTLTRITKEQFDAHFN